MKKGKCNYKSSRRKFIRNAGLAAFGLSTPFSSILRLNTLNAAAISNSSVASGDYKALVCFFHTGGNDSFNMLIPRGASEYADYQTTRSGLAIPQNQILGINPMNSMGQQFGMHPSMPGVQNLFDSGKLSFISNLGTMIEPTTKATFLNDQVQLPLGLFSHSDQIQQWQSARPHERNPIGWGGRVADMIMDMNDNNNISMNVSMTGTNVFQYGQNTVQFTADRRTGAEGILGYDLPWGNNPERMVAIDKMFDHSYSDMYRETYAKTIRTSRDSSIEFQAAIDEIGPLLTPFSNNYISESFNMIARTIAARDILGFKRQIFFVDFGGWDHHDELLESHSDMLGWVDNAMVEFAAALEEIGAFDCVTTFSMSEFGRTLTSNGNGTDHAWGGNVMVMGGDVNGQEIYGDYPSLALGSQDEIYDGVIIPKLSTDEYFAELALWFGVSNIDLPLLFPNLGNFYDIYGGNAPIGFLNI